MNYKWELFKPNGRVASFQRLYNLKITINSIMITIPLYSVLTVWTTVWVPIQNQTVPATMRPGDR